MGILKRLRRAPASHRAKWILDNMKSRKSVLVIGNPEGHEVVALRRKNKLDVLLTEPKAHMDGVKYISKIEKQYGYVIVFSLHLEQLSWDEIKRASKNGVFVVLPVGNGSKDRARSSTKLVRSYNPLELQSLMDFAVEMKIVRNGEYVDDDGSQYCAVKGKHVVQVAYLHFKAI